MSEHHGSSFVHSCVKVPVDPYTRQPTPSYERPRIQRVHKNNTNGNKNRRINFISTSLINHDSNRDVNGNSDDSNMESFIDFIDSIPDYGEVHHLSNEQFKQKLDYLKRKQRILLKNLENCFDEVERNEESPIVQQNKSINPSPSTPTIPNKSNRWNEDLRLLGKKCNFEDSRTCSPLLYSSGTFAGLAEDQDLLTYRGKDDEKSLKTLRNREISSAGKSWSTWSESKSIESADSDCDSVETRSLPPSSPKRWQPTLPKPFSFALRDEAEKYMSQTEVETAEILRENNKGGPTRKRRVRPIPLTSRIPLYDKLIAAKEERSRMIREESAWCLMSQVKPFKLECDRRAVRAMSRSSPELCSRNFDKRSISRFKAKPVPKNLFGTDIYDRMLEDEYLRQVEKKIRAAELMKASSLPPSMARRERIKSAIIPKIRNCSNNEIRNRTDDSSRICSVTPVPSERSRSGMTEFSGRGNNLAAILRCQASREKLEKEVREKMEEKAHEYAVKIREMVTSRKPAWRALRHTARTELSRDLDFRASLRRDEAREQAERHRLEMEMMLDRVTQIPTLFERHSQMENNLQSFQTMRQLKSRGCKLGRRKKKRKPKSDHSSTTDSEMSRGCIMSRPDSGSFTSAIRTSPGGSLKSSVSSRKSEYFSNQLDDSVVSKKKSERGLLRVSINEKAELIEDNDGSEKNEKLSSNNSNNHDNSVITCNTSHIKY